MKVETVQRRYKAYAGFVTTPRYFDDSPQQFLQVAPAGTGILQRVNHIHDIVLPHYEAMHRCRLQTGPGSAESA